MAVRRSSFSPRTYWTIPQDGKEGEERRLVDRWMERGSLQGQRLPQYLPLSQKRAKAQAAGKRAGEKPGSQESLAGTQSRMQRC